MKFSQFLKEESYKEFFAKKLKKYGVNSPSELSDADKKKFYDEVDAEWEGEDEELEEKMKDKPYEKQIGMGDSRSEKELRDQINGLSDDTLKKWASKPAGMLGSKVRKLQDKLVAAEMKKRGLKEAVEREQTFKRGDEVIIKYRDSGTGKVLKTNKDGTIKVKWRQTQISTNVHPSKLTNLDAPLKPFKKKLVELEEGWKINKNTYFMGKDVGPVHTHHSGYSIAKIGGKWTISNPDDEKSGEFTSLAKAKSEVADLTESVELDEAVKYKTRPDGKHNVRATVCYIKPMTGKRECEDIYFASKMEALGFKDNVKGFPKGAEVEAIKEM
jgi:hypothetical protein